MESQNHFYVSLLLSSLLKFNHLLSTDYKKKSDYAHAHIALFLIFHPEFLKYSEKLA